jgi:hypothetical protein
MVDDFNDWLALGLEKGWITEPFCNTHEGYQFLTDEQQEEFNEGGDPCVVVIQIKESEG